MTKEKVNFELVEIVHSTGHEDCPGENTGPMSSYFMISDDSILALPDRRQTCHPFDVVLRMTRVGGLVRHQFEDALKRYDFPSELQVEDSFETNPAWMENGSQLRAFREFLEYAWRFNRQKMPKITSEGEYSKTVFTAVSHKQPLTITEKHVRDFVAMKSKGVLRPMLRKKPRLRLVS